MTIDPVAGERVFRKEFLSRCEEKHPAGTAESVRCPKHGIHAAWLGSHYERAKALREAEASFDSLVEARLVCEKLPVDGRELLGLRTSFCIEVPDYRLGAAVGFEEDEELPLPLGSFEELKPEDLVGGDADGLRPSNPQGLALGDLGLPASRIARGADILRGTTEDLLERDETGFPKFNYSPLKGDHDRGDEKRVLKEPTANLVAEFPVPCAPGLLNLSCAFSCECVDLRD